MLTELQNWLFNQKDQMFTVLNNWFFDQKNQKLQNWFFNPIDQLNVVIGGPKHYLVIFIAINIITFFLFGIDKLMASTKKRSKIFKRSLILWSMIGIIGAFLGMLVFSHYIRRMWFIRLLIIFFISHLAYFTYEFIVAKHFTTVNI